MHFLQGPRQKVYIFYANSFLYVLQKKSRNNLYLRPHDTYFLFRTFFSQVTNKLCFFWLTISLFIICFYAIMHRTTIVQNKIISTICSWHFLCPANIYRPSLGKVLLGRPNPKLIQLLNFYLRIKRKKSLYSELYALQRTEAGFSIFIYLKKKLKFL